VRRSGNPGHAPRIGDRRFRIPKSDCINKSPGCRLRNGGDAADGVRGMSPWWIFIFIVICRPFGVPDQSCFDAR
jgi:hypothetical protein